MKALREAGGQDLQWSGKDEFELRSGDEVLARLHAREKGADWTRGEAADGRWALKTRNIGSGEIVVITKLDSQEAIAIVKRGRKQGLFTRRDDYLEFSDGHILTWNKASRWRDEWDWADSDGSALIRFQRGQHVVIEPSARSLRELSLLVIVGWQLLKLQGETQRKAAMAAAAATTGSTVVVNH